MHTYLALKCATERLYEDMMTWTQLWAVSGNYPRHIAIMPWQLRRLKEHKNDNLTRRYILKQRLTRNSSRQVSNELRNNIVPDGVGTCSIATCYNGHHTAANMICSADGGNEQARSHGPSNSMYRLKICRRAFEVRQKNVMPIQRNSDKLPLTSVW